MFYRVQKGVKKGAPAGSVSGCGGGCGFPQPFCRTRTGVAVSRRCRAVPLRAALLLFRCVGWCGLHDRLPGQREAQHGLSFGSPVGRECVVKPRMRRRDPRGGHGEQDRSRAERIGREKGLAAVVAGRNAERRQCERKSREESFHASFGIFANIAKSAGWPRCRGRCVPAFGTDVSR